MKEIISLYAIFKSSSGISTDTRKETEGKLFFALSGPNFNGNLYAKKALELGAKAAVIDDADIRGLEDDRVIHVDEAKQTLQLLAAYHRRQLGRPVIGVTGSNGKTTTKELLHRVLSRRFNVHTTKGNLNNQIGVPLTLLEATEAHDILLIEMGTSVPGEIQRLAEIAQPDYGIITNVGKAHIEELGSLEGVLHEKTALYREVVANGGVCFVPTHDQRLADYAEDLEGAFRYGLAEDVRMTPDASFMTIVQTEPSIHYRMAGVSQNLTSPLYGVHNAFNISSAVAVGKYFGVENEEIAKAIEGYAPDNNRSQIIRREGSGVIFCDAYNANPNSVKAAIDSLVRWPGEQKVAIIGDMLELGENAQQEHQEMIAFLVSTGNPFYLVGKTFKAISDQAFIDVDELILSGVLDRLAEDQASSILIKGSRSIRLERIYPLLGIDIE